jgi:uncharacterized sodium:solute symporter family permease YidK
MSKTTWYDIPVSLKWWQVGLSIFAADHTVSFVVNSANDGYRSGLANGTYAWNAGLIIALVSLFIVPKLMRSGARSIAEYVRIRVGIGPGLLVGIAQFLLLCLAFLPASLFIAASLFNTFFPSFALPLHWTVAVLLLFAIPIPLFGGLRTQMNLDTIIALILILCGVLVLIFSLIEVGGIKNLGLESPQHYRTLLPAASAELPWTHTMIGGFWFGHLFYWAFYQPIQQKVLGLSSIPMAQKALLLVASLKLVVPFLYVLPGIIVREFFANELPELNSVFTFIIQNLIPDQLQWLFIAGMSATVIASLGSIILAAASLWTRDIMPFIGLNSKTIVWRDGLPLSILLISVLALLAGLILPEFVNLLSWNRFSAYYIGLATSAIAIWVMFFNRFRPSAVYIIGATWLVMLVLFTIGFRGNINPMSITEWVGLLLFVVLIPLLTRFYPPEARPIQQGVLIKHERSLLVSLWSVFLFTGVLSMYVLFNA